MGLDYRTERISVPVQEYCTIRIEVRDAQGNNIYESP